MIRTLALAVSAFLALSGEVQANDWYVKAGADGDGTKAKPFGDIQAAVDKAVVGDVIHVVQGAYHGAFNSGFIVLDKPGLTLAGGYKDESFAERNPFLYPTFIIEDPGTKDTAFQGGYIRTEKGGARTQHESTTIDGFWFDRKGQNKYDKEGNFVQTIPPPHNTKTVMTFEEPDCHILNCVFANTAQVSVRICGDLSSVENCLFVNVNMKGLYTYSMGRKVSKGSKFYKIKISHNTFVSTWNANDSSDASGPFIYHSGGKPGAHLEITDNIFTMGKGGASKGWVVVDVVNFAGDRWVTFSRNSCSKFPEGYYYFYSKQLTKCVRLSKAADISKAPVAEAKDNDDEDPGFELQKEWLDAYDKGATCQAYPIDHVKTGALFTPKNEKLKGRGVQTAGPFSIVRGSLLPAGDAKVRPLEEYKEIDWDTLWQTGEQLADKPIKVKCYYEPGGTGFASGFGKQAVSFLGGADPTKSKALSLREVPEMEKGQSLKGYMRLGGPAADYVDKEASTPAPMSGECEAFFFVYAVVRPAAAKLIGKGPQVVLEIETIKAD